MIVLDASVWVSAVFASDVNHAASRQWKIVWQEQGLGVIVPSLFFPEVSGALSRRSSDVEAVTAAVAEFRREFRPDIVSLNAESAQVAGTVAADLRLRGADAVYVSTAHWAGLPLLTWDSEVRERTRGFVESLTPIEMLEKIVLTN